jgi:general secretion pathway protein I
MFKFNSRSKNGFTLLETVIAMVILSAALVLLSTSWGGAFMRVTKAQRSFEVSSLLERKMTEIDLEYRGKRLEEIPETKEGEFDGVENYTWKMTSKKLELPDISGSLTARDGGADQMTMTIIKQMTEAMSKSIKEVTVSVIYTKAKKPLEFSVTTYFVDYDKELPLGIPGGG